MALRSKDIIVGRAEKCRGESGWSMGELPESPSFQSGGREFVGKVEMRWERGRILYISVTAKEKCKKLGKDEQQIIWLRMFNQKIGESMKTGLSREIELHSLY